MAATTGSTPVLFALAAAAGADFDDTREFREEQQQRQQTHASVFAYDTPRENHLGSLGESQR